MRKNSLKNTLMYTALGDSLTLGVGTFFSSGFDTRYKKLAENTLQVPILLKVFAKNGATSGDVLESIHFVHVQKAIYNADIITITAGGNDLIQAAKIVSRTNDFRFFEQTRQYFIRHMTDILKKIHLIKSTSTRPFIVRIVDLYNPFPQTPGNVYWVQLFNHDLKRFTNHYTKVADIYFPFQQSGKSLLSIDGLHPNRKGYQIIALSLHRLGYFPLLNVNVSLQ
jgi:lysophospholipase L1-like esterase